MWHVPGSLYLCILGFCKSALAGSGFFSPICFIEADIPKAAFGIKAVPLFFSKMANLSYLLF